MKPPQRRRAAPARYRGELTGPTPWNPREKRQLLRLLQARRAQPEPDAAELARELPGRTEAEIRDFLQQLKGRVIREAFRRECPQKPRHREAQPPAPIEVWMDLAEKITGPLEEALTAAFSQVLTIAATEPLSLLHSKPPKPTKTRGKLLFLSSTRGQEDPKPRDPGGAPEACGPTPGAPGTPGPALEACGPTPGTHGAAPEASGPTPGASGTPVPTPETSGPTPGAPGTPCPAPEASDPDPVASTEGDFTVDFEKIYKYLSFSCRSARSPELSAAESAVVLDLLLSLPEELSCLPCTALMKHMEETYARLTAPAPQPNPNGGTPGPGAQDSGTGPSRPEEPGQVTSQVPEPRELRSAWQAAGMCPLNPFLVPLELLGQVATPAE
ncbi:snRNA-activating protein complex subunit 2 [Perognathus longimembris pacificus]|uniref:snRNA-activating protein complex subunit 2 n=1 Tax=Perognathus longimembris pacificus TaxID=214514 RepID=UPI00201950E9|nr:snRNA-activating protein complex subunit 2 [Perognathus longimembris pacificus]